MLHERRTRMTVCTSMPWLLGPEQPKVQGDVQSGQRPGRWSGRSSGTAPRSRPLRPWPWERHRAWARPRRNEGTDGQSELPGAHKARSLDRAKYARGRYFGNGHALFYHDVWSTSFACPCLVQFLGWHAQTQVVALAAETLMAVVFLAVLLLGWRQGLFTRKAPDNGGVEFGSFAHRTPAHCGHQFPECLRLERLLGLRPSLARSLGFSLSGCIMAHQILAACHPACHSLV